MLQSLESFKIIEVFVCPRSLLGLWRSMRMLNGWCNSRFGLGVVASVSFVSSLLSRMCNNLLEHRCHRVPKRRNTKPTAATCQHLRRNIPTAKGSSKAAATHAACSPWNHEAFTNELTMHSAETLHSALLDHKQGSTQRDALVHLNAISNQGSSFKKFWCSWALQYIYIYIYYRYRYIYTRMINDIYVYLVYVINVCIYIYIYVILKMLYPKKKLFMRSSIFVKSLESYSFGCWETFEIWWRLELETSSHNASGKTDETQSWTPTSCKCGHQGTINTKNLKLREMSFIENVLCLENVLYGNDHFKNVL